jgi:hypothetical protein
MDKIKTTLVICGAIVVAFLMISVMSVVPQVQGNSVMDRLDQVKQMRNLQVFKSTYDYRVEAIHNFSDIINVINIQEFRGHFTSKDFAQLFMKSEIQHFLHSHTYNNFYNNSNVQTFLHCKPFAAFMNTSIAHDFLANINCDGINSASQNCKALLVRSHTNTFNLFSGLFVGLFSRLNGVRQLGGIVWILALAIMIFLLDFGFVFLFLLWTMLNSGWFPLRLIL